MKEGERTWLEEGTCNLANTQFFYVRGSGYFQLSCLCMPSLYSFLSACKKLISYSLVSHGNVKTYVIVLEFL